MEFGIAVATSTGSWRVAQRAEELGFREVWFYDTQLLNPDVFVCMALAAERTRAIRLSTGVLIPSNRIAPVTANALATLNKLAPGRIKFGVGTGFTGRRTMGMKAIRRRDFERYVEAVLALLRGETVEIEIEGAARQVRFLNPDFDLINLDAPIPLAVSAFGPRMRRLAAEWGAEWLNFGGTVEAAIADVTDMKAAWTECGRQESTMRAVEFTLGCVLREGEAADSARAKAQAGPLVAALLHGLLETPGLDESAAQLPPELGVALTRYRPIYESYRPQDARYLTLHRGHLMFLRPEEEPLITGDLLRSYAWVGDEDELRDRARRLEEAGYTQLTVQVVEGHEDALDDWARVFGLS